MKKTHLPFLISQLIELMCIQSTSYLLFCPFNCDFDKHLIIQVLPSWKSTSQGSIAVKIRTTEPNGLLMFNAGEGNSVSDVHIVKQGITS